MPDKDRDTGLCGKPKRIGTVQHISARRAKPKSAPLPCPVPAAADNANDTAPEHVQTNRTAADSQKIPQKSQMNTVSAAPPAEQPRVIAAGAPYAPNNPAVQSERLAVEFSVPRYLVPGQPDLLELLLCEKSLEGDQAGRRDSSPLRSSKSDTCMLMRGAEYSVRFYLVNAPEGCVQPAEAQLRQWTGGFQRVQAMVLLPPDCADAPVMLCMELRTGEYTSHLMQQVQCSLTPPAPAAELRKQSVFISYSHEDIDTVFCFRAGMELSGIPEIESPVTVLIDKASLQLGEQWEDRLHALIDECDYFLLIWSHNAARSDEVKKEIRYAAKHKSRRALKIYPLVQYEELPPPEEFQHLHCENPAQYIPRRHADGAAQSGGNSNSASQA